MARAELCTLADEQEIDRISVLAKRYAGIDVGRGKKDFLYARLSNHMSELNCDTLSEYCASLEGDSSGEKIERFIESLTTHTTSFFRESKHFKWLTSEGIRLFRKNTPDRSQPMTIWSAACSTGQELYTAMMALEFVRQSNFENLNFCGNGTDISNQVLSQAKRAVYNIEEIDGIPVEYRRKFLLSSKKDESLFRIIPNIRSKTNWALANLVEQSSIKIAAADVVFLRNVLIYFDKTDQNKVIENVVSKIRAGGFLITGHSESSIVKTNSLEQIVPTIYGKI